MKITKEVRLLIARALQEDIGTGDITSDTLFSNRTMMQAHIVARAAGIVCGITIVAELFRSIDKRIVVKTYVQDGSRVQSQDCIMTLHGSARSILRGERTALNFLGRLSGISTLTGIYGAAVKGTHAKIYDTRKTLPGYRLLEKYAVRQGGGYNHRFGLYDQVLIKDNHIAVYAQTNPSNLRLLVLHVRNKIPKSVAIEVEADTLAQVVEVLPAHPDIILLDNMNLVTLRTAVRLIKKEQKKCKVKIISEASGGITMRSIYAVARTGVDRISIGALTHSAPGLDFALDVIE